MKIRIMASSRRTRLLSWVKPLMTTNKTNVIWPITTLSLRKRKNSNLWIKNYRLVNKKVKLIIRHCKKSIIRFSIWLKDRFRSLIIYRARKNIWILRCSRTEKVIKLTKYSIVVTVTSLTLVRRKKLPPLLKRITVVLENTEAEADTSV